MVKVKRACPFVDDENRPYKKKSVYPDANHKARVKSWNPPSKALKPILVPIAENILKKMKWKLQQAVSLINDAIVLGKTVKPKNVWYINASRRKINVFLQRARVSNEVAPSLKVDKIAAPPVSAQENVNTELAPMLPPLHFERGQVEGSNFAVLKNLSCLTTLDKLQKSKPRENHSRLFNNLGYRGNSALSLSVPTEGSNQPRTSFYRCFKRNPKYLKPELRKKLSLKHMNNVPKMFICNLCQVDIWSIRSHLITVEHENVLRRRGILVPPRNRNENEWNFFEDSKDEKDIIFVRKSHRESREKHYSAIFSKRSGRKPSPGFFYSCFERNPIIFDHKKFICTLCKVAISSIRSHLISAKHETVLRSLGIHVPSRRGDEKVVIKKFSCVLCDVKDVGKKNLKAHVRGKKHKKNIAAAKNCHNFIEKRTTKEIDN